MTVSVSSSAQNHRGSRFRILREIPILALQRGHRDADFLGPDGPVSTRRSPELRIPPPRPVLHHWQDPGTLESFCCDLESLSRGRKCHVLVLRNPDSLTLDFIQKGHAPS